MFKIPLFGLSSVFYTSCTKKEPYLFIGKTHKFKNCLNLMTLTTGTKISATNSKTYKGFKYNANNSSKDVEISGDGTTIINVYYDRVLCTVNFKTRKNNYSQWQTAKTETGLYGANLPEGAWDTSTYAWYQYKDGWNRVSGLCVILTSFDFETAGYANNTGNESSDGIVTTCNFYGKEGKGLSLIHI